MKPKHAEQCSRSELKLKDAFSDTELSRRHSLLLPKEQLVFPRSAPVYPKFNLKQHEKQHEDEITLV